MWVSARVAAVGVVVMIVRTEAVPERIKQESLALVRGTNKKNTGNSDSSSNRSFNHYGNDNTYIIMVIVTIRIMMT